MTFDDESAVAPARYGYIDGIVYDPETGAILYGLGEDERSQRDQLAGRLLGANEQRDYWTARRAVFQGLLSKLTDDSEKRFTTETHSFGERTTTTRKWKPAAIGNAVETKLKLEELGTPELLAIIRCASSYSFTTLKGDKGAFDKELVREILEKGSWETESSPWWDIKVRPQQAGEIQMLTGRQLAEMGIRIEPEEQPEA